VLDLWEHIFGDGRGLLHIWTGRRLEGGGDILKETVQHANFPYPKATRKAAEWALEKSGQDGREVYFCAHLLAQARRVKENAAEISTLYAEYDGGGDVPTGELEPSAVVESSPGHYHCYWRLSTAIPPTVAEGLNERIARATGADPSGGDLTQLLRVPGTTNKKYPEEPVVQFTEVSEISYVPRELDEMLPPLPEEDAAEEGGGGDGGDDGAVVAADGEDEPPVVLDPWALKVWRGEDPKLKEGGEVDRSATLLKIGNVLYKAGLTRRPIIEALHERDVALGYDKYTDRRDAKEYERIYDKKLSKNGRHPGVILLGKSGSQTGASAEKEEAAPPEPPTMDEAAYRGIFGRIVDMVAPHTEGDPVAILGNALVYFGNVLGRGPHMMVGATPHHPNLYLALVGKTARGRKGSASDPLEDIFLGVDEHWSMNRVLSGLSSGEGLITEVRDPVQAPDKDGEMRTVDPGVEDKRLLIVEGELSQALKVMKREGNTLSPVLRNGWDGKTLRTLVKNNPLRSTRPHISVIGHITGHELVRHLTETEMANGFANRFIFLYVARSKKLPFGGEWFSVDPGRIRRDVQKVIQTHRTPKPVRMTWSAEAKPAWIEAYDELTRERPGLFGAITARAEAQTLRLAMIYTLADGKTAIGAEHVEAALAVWRYAEESARYVFGEAIGDPDADRIYKILRSTPQGLTRTEVNDHFSGNKKAAEIDRIRNLLLDGGLINVTKVKEPEAKRPTERWIRT